MLARLFGMLLGMGLGGLGYAILTPGGLEGRVPYLALGPFEPMRMFVIAICVGLGAMLFVAALLPKEKPAGKKRRKPHDGPPITVDFTSGQALQQTLAPSRPPPPPHRPAPARHPSSSAQRGSFAETRQALRSFTRAERWGDAASAVRRLASLASSPMEKILAAQDAGDFARSQGLIEDAAHAYGEALSLARHIGAKAQIADALTNVGDMAYDAHRLDKAVEAYDEALSLRRYLLKQAPRDLQAQRALSLALERLADVREDRGHRVRALDLYRESMGISVALASQDPKRFGLDLAITRKRVAELEAKINA